MARQRQEKPIERSIYTLDLNRVVSEGVETEEDLLASYSIHPAAEEDLKQYLNLAHEPNFISKAFKKLFHVIGWGFRMILPSFLVGHPSLFDNIKTLWKNPQFRPLRMLGVAWLVFLLVVASLGFYSIRKASHASASSGPQIQTGYYVGTGATLSITGLGFAPQVVIIKSDTAAGSTVWKSSVMPAGEYAYLGSATADNTENQISLDSDGFSVQVMADVNSLNVRYTYIAFAGSDCTSSGSICVGSYTGNGAASQIVPTGFQPDLVINKRAAATAGNFHTSAMSTNNASFLSATADDATGVFFQTLNTNGFTVGTSNDTNSAIFYFLAFKNASNFLAVGSFPGDSSVGKVISGVGFTPNFALVKSSSAVVPAYNITQTWGDYSSLTTGANAANAIQKLQSDGFVVGNSANSNTTGNGYQYFAFGGATSTPPSGSFTMKYGSYTGNGNARSITGLGFSPDLVMIKSDATANYSVWSTSLDNNLTHYFALGTAGTDFAGAITSTDSDGFSLGTNATVNTNAIVYEYVAFGNATKPGRAPGAANFIVGAYTGSGVDGRAVDNLPMTPDMVVTKPNSTAVAAWQTSAMSTNNAAFFSAAANDATGAYFKTLNSDGFTLGLSANAVGTIHHFFAFKKGTGIFNVGSYSGTGVAHDITGLGFQPSLVWDKISTITKGAVHRSSSGTITGTNAQNFLNLANVTGAINGFVLDGFTVGTAVEANSNTIAYNWAAWKAPAPLSGPNMPTNSSPANASTTVGLNPTLTGSAYSDPGANSQTNTQWQVDDNSDFSAPVWTRTVASAESSVVVNSSNGTFADSLAGKTELAHNTVYYWRVRYSNGLWSTWSTGTNFTTNVFQTPTNQSPTDGATVQTLTPSLTASAFSDQQGSHASTSAEWQVDKTSAFSSPSYDSGEVAYSNSFAVPSAILSNQTTYYWRVRYKDSGGQWSAYSTPTRFLVSQSVISVKSLFSNTVVNQGDQINIDAQINLTDGTVVNDASTTISIYNPSGTKIVTAATMNYLSGSNGIYRYTYTVPSSNGSYLYEITATEGTNNGYGAGNFQVKTIASDISALNSTAATINSNVNTINSTVATISSNLSTIQTNIASLISEIGTGNIAAIKTKTDTINWGDVTGILATTSAIKAKTDTIAWSDITGIKTKTDTINWADVTGIKLKTDSIDWGDISTIKANVATLITQIGTGNIAAIKTKTDSINWGDITGLVTSAGDIKNTTDTIDWNDITAIKTDTDTIDWNDVTGIKTKTDTINWGDVTDTKNAVQTVQGSLDMLVGALIVTQSSVNDSTPSSSLFYTNLINTTDNFYKNAVMTFTSGDLKGQSRRIAGYTGSSKTIRLDPALTSAPANGDEFTIVAQNVHVEETVNDIASTTADTNAKVSDIQSKVNTILPLLQSVDGKLDTVQTSVNTLRASQQSTYTLNFTSSPTIETGKAYRAKLEIVDFQSAPADASSVPTITIYDSNRVATIIGATMTKTSTGVYEYNYTVPSSAPSGLWESVVTVPLGSNSQSRTNYWTVNGSPAKVEISSMASVTVPNISANAIITNEGTTATEYQYQWCTVTNQSDSCGSPNAVDAASAAKLIQPGDSFTPVLPLNVPNAGNYWFKLLVTFGSQTSAASRSFTAISSSNSGGSGGSVSSSSGGYSSSAPVSIDDIRNQLQINSIQLNKMLGILGNVDPQAPGFSSLLSINEQNTASVKDIQNKVADLKTVSATLHQIANQKSVDPIVQTYMKFNSVELDFLITNPDTKATTVHFKAFLPDEAKPADIMNSDGLKVDYDATAKAYYVSGDIDLEAGQSVTRKVEIKDIWAFPATDLQDLLSQAHSISASLANVQYAAQASLLENDAKAKASTIENSQAASYDTPENHIVVYRQNQINFQQVTDDINKLKDLLVQSGASQGLLGKIGGIQAFATWGIILAIVFGFILLAGIIFAMWRNQMMLTALAMKVHKRQNQLSSHINER